ncbi:hypothetical protein TIFTF001_056214 [Ficus carica]|uniref:Uncharacterized protein n=1 Tax=Ficus carica TaxID=3494 RepID=A0AA88EGU9_FICCA|nr:hypothetical protein TIFTF001_056214 [Ficus carica]
MEQDKEEKKSEEATKEQDENINDQIPKQKRSRNSRLGQKRSGPVVESGSAAHALTKMVKVYAFP